MILIRVPDHADWVGKPLPPAFWSALTANRGQVVDMPGLLGRMRITGIAGATPDDLDGITVAVGLSPAAAFADIDAATWRGLILIGLGASLALAAALLAGRAFIREPVRRLLRAASAWLAGDLGARSGLSGPGEFGQLGEAFDAMAASLQKHEGELRAELARSHLLQERQTMMLHELNHRVRNTLTTVQSLARQSRRGDDRGERLEGRILSLSKTHDLLSRDEWGGASLRTVLENELAPFQDEQAHRFGLDGPDLDLPPRYVLALGMTVHELTTNAAKYGALSVENGRVDVTWRVITGESGARRLALEWRESGGRPCRNRASAASGPALSPAASAGNSAALFGWSSPRRVCAARSTCPSTSKTVSPPFGKWRPASRSARPENGNVFRTPFPSQPERAYEPGQSTSAGDVLGRNSYGWTPSAAGPCAPATGA